MTLIQYLFKFSILFFLAYVIFSKSIYRVKEISEPPIGIHTSIQKSSLKLNFEIEEGYGIQKKAHHYITLYELKKNARKIRSTKKKIQKYSHKLETLKSFQGITAKENNKYFKFVNKWKFKTPLNDNKQYAIEGRIFYCSFKKNYCSIKRFHQLL